jgi:hypothetical protein
MRGTSPGMTVANGWNAVLVMPGLEPAISMLRDCRIKSGNNGQYANLLT